MKSAAIILLSIFCNTASCQQDNEAIKKAINTFFEDMKSMILQ